MAESPADAIEFRLTVKSTEVTQEPGLVDRYIRNLRDRLSVLQGLDTAAFTFLLAPAGNSLGGVVAGTSEVPNLYRGLQFNLACDRFRTVWRCVGDWLDATKLENLFVIELPPTHVALIQTADPKVLAQLLPVGESLLSPQQVYAAKVKSYIDIFGEITPSARANLAILRHHLGLSDLEAESLEGQVLGPFRTLAEKYEHFRQALLSRRQESDLEGDFWEVMQDRAEAMGLPLSDAQFLKDERRRVLQAEADQERRSAEAKTAAERQQLQENQQRQQRYGDIFAALAREVASPALRAQAAGDPGNFHRALMAQIAASNWRRGQLDQAREFYGLDGNQAEGLEKSVVDELYLSLS